MNWSKQYLEFEKKYGAIQSRFFAIEGDKKKAKEEFDYVKKLAIDTAQDIEKTAESYSIFYSAAGKSMGKDSAREVFKDWTQVSRVLHLTPFQFERVTYALRELTSKGAIYSQDLRMQIGTHIPDAMGLAQEAAEKLGFTGADWFDKLQKAAKANQPLINEFIKLFSEAGRKRFASPEALREALKQPDALVNYIKNMGKSLLFEFSDRGGNELVIKILGAIRDAVLSIDVEKLATHLGDIAKMVGKIVDYLPIIVQLLKDLGITLALGWGLGKLVGLFKSFYSFFRILRAKPLLVLGKLIPSALFKNIGKVGLKGALGLGLKAMGLGLKAILPKILTGIIGGPLGIIIGILWSVRDVVNWRRKKDKEKRGIEFTSFLEGLGKSGSEVLDMMRLLQEASNKNPNFSVQDARKMAEKYVGKEGSQLVNVTDQGQVVLNFNGMFLTIDEIQDMIEQSTKAEIEKKESFWDRFKPKPSSEEIF